MSLALYLLPVSNMSKTHYPLPFEPYHSTRILPIGCSLTQSLVSYLTCKNMVEDNVESLPEIYINDNPHPPLSHKSSHFITKATRLVRYDLPSVTQSPFSPPCAYRCAPRGLALWFSQGQSEAEWPVVHQLFFFDPFWRRVLFFTHQESPSISINFEWWQKAALQGHWSVLPASLDAAQPMDTYRLRFFQVTPVLILIHCY